MQWFVFFSFILTVLESGGDGISTLTYFSQNSEKTENFLLINLQNKHYKLA